jgi:hypothetical protein
MTAQLPMLHGTIIPEHECDGELTELPTSTASVHKAWCSSCGAEFTYLPDSDWVSFALRGMQGVTE